MCTKVNCCHTLDNPDVSFPWSDVGFHLAIKWALLNLHAGSAQGTVQVDFGCFKLCAG